MTHWQNTIFSNLRITLSLIIVMLEVLTFGSRTVMEKETLVGNPGVMKKQEMMILLFGLQIKKRINKSKNIWCITYLQNKFFSVFIQIMVDMLRLQTTLRV